MSTSKVQHKANPEWVRQGATVKAMREMRGLTLDQLASRLILSDGQPMSRPYLSNIEAGRKRLTPLLIARIAEALAVPQIAIARPDDDDAVAA